jgi:Histone methylation protein DOT1
MDIILIISLLFTYLLLFIFVLAFILWLGQSILFPAPFLPLPRKVVARLSEIANIPSNGYFYDLGSGDGRVVRAVAAKYPTASCVGVEKALTYSKRRNTDYYLTDYNKVFLKQADMVFLYLWPEAMLEMKIKLKSELASGAKVICCRFPLPEAKPLAKEVVSAGGHEYTLYIYRAGSL